MKNQLNDGGGLVSDCKEVVQQIYKNRYFTNHGPLARQFESEVGEYLDVDNAVTVTNKALAVLIAIFGSNNGKKTAVLHSCGKDIFDAAIMSGVDFFSMSSNVLMQELDTNIEVLVIPSMVLNVDSFNLFDKLISKGMKLIVCYPFIVGHSRCCNLKGAISVYSLGQEGFFQGGIIATDDNELAEVYRNIRSSYGAKEVLEVKATCNGRFSELQAGLGLKLLSRLDKLSVERMQASD